MACSVSILVIMLCAWASATEPVTAVIERRKGAHPAYGGDFAEEYGPYAVAAFPLHAPVPILHVLSPPGYANWHSRPPKRPKPERDVYAFDTSHIEHSYEPYADLVYATQPKYSKERDQYEDEASSVIVYARPNKNGGFSYRKPSVPKPVHQPRENEPIIIRIHKYRVIH